MLTKDEYSKAAGEMQDIWNKKLQSLEAIAVQSLLNGNKDSIDYGKQEAKEFKIIKDTVDKCISIISTRYTIWSTNAKTD